MKGCLNALGLGFGVAFGAGLIYLFVMDPTAWIIFLGLGMFVLGGIVVGAALLIHNRQWTQATFNSPPPRISNNFRMPPAYPPTTYYPPMLPPGQPQGYQPEMDPYAFPIVENQQAANALTDDSPMA